MLIGPCGDSLYWTETGTCIVRKLDFASGWVSTVAGIPRVCVSSSNVTSPALSAGFSAGGPFDLAYSGSDLLITDVTVVRRLESATGNVSLFAGTPNHPSNLTGVSYTTASFHVLRGIAVDSSSGTVYLADNVSHLSAENAACPAAPISDSA